MQESSRILTQETERESVTVCVQVRELARRAYEHALGARVFE